MPTLVRPATCDAGIQQIKTALKDTRPKNPEFFMSKPAHGSALGIGEDGMPYPPARVVLYMACEQLMNDQTFLEDGLRVLYEANEIVSFLFNTIVPHLEERLRFNTLNEEYNELKPHHLQQNTTRFRAIMQAVNEAMIESEKRDVTPAYAKMRTAMRPLLQDDVIVDGFQTLYVSSKTARKALELIFERLMKTFKEDNDIVKTTDIPMEAMFL